MERDHDRSRSFTRRAFVIGALQTGLVAVLGGRLAWLEIVEASKYRLLADQNSVSMRLLAPPRGLIVDRAGTPLAINAQNFRAIIVPEQAGDIADALSKLAKLVPLTQRDIEKIVKQAEHSPAFIPIEAKDNLDWEEVSRVEVQLPDLPGISIDEGQVRQYPLGPATAHLVGYVGAVSKTEQEDQDDPLLSLPGFQVGKSGIEKAFDDDMRGTAGSAAVEVNVVGRTLRELSRDDGKPGAEVKLTIDADLQKFLQDRLGEERSASGVVMDAVTGAIYALTSSPAFDPNVFTRGLTPEVWQAMTTDPGRPLNNKAIGGVYPPGSTYKISASLAALELGVITPGTTQFCPGHFDIGDKRFYCDKREGHGTLDLVGAITKSCDVYFYKLANDVGVDRFAKYAHKFGLGDKTGIELPEEKPGLIPTSAWKKKTNKDDPVWHPGETVITAIGQGYNLVTPLQLAVYLSRVISGRVVKPHVVDTVGGESVADTNFPPLGIGDAHRDAVMRGMAGVVNSQGGTAYTARIMDPRFAMGGKTGSAQVKHIREGEYRHNQDLPWELRDQALFMAFAPLGNPRYVCSVVVEHGVHGGSSAAPIARDMLVMTQQKNPAGIAYPPAAEQEAKNGQG